MIRKTRLLAGFMAAVLLSTTCSGGAYAAGEDGITTLNASASEDESTTWNATVTAGETLFPAGTELRFAVADEEARAAVQEQLLTENAREEGNAEEDTTAGKTLQDLHVYDFGLTDAEGAKIDYTDKITYSVKSSSAADTDTDATDYAVYRVNENEDSGEGVTVALEPIEDSTGIVKLDASGWMTEFSVETEPVEQIAVAVYEAAAAETEEDSGEGDGTEGEEEAGDVGVSTFAAVNKDNSNTFVIGTEKVRKDSYAPMNNLMILDNIPGASVEVIDWDKKGGVATYDPSTDPTAPYTGYQIKIVGAEKETDGKENSVDAALSQGNFWYNATYNDGIGPGNSMYKDMRGSSGDLHYGGIAVMFKGSDPNIQCEEGESYQWTYDVGWPEADQKIETTSMWVTLLYKNAGYYKGELVNAVAKISVTPSKNRNPETPYDSTGGYKGVYNPMIQVSGSLYRGWVWQNVEQFHVDLSFYYADKPIEDSNKILIGAENNSTMDYQSMFADYYTINSLNPAEDTTSWESTPRYIGPEYVLPTQKITHAYIVDDFTVDGQTYTSNIQKEYITKYSESNTYTQVAYNGGDNAWGGAGVDELDAPRFAQNSIMIIPEQTTTLSFTMGKMERLPWYNGGEGKDGLTQATNMMWATISTRPFTQTRVPVNINFTKSWDNMTSTELANVKSVELELWLDSDNRNPEKLREITITKNEEDEWKGTFELVPDLKFYTDHEYINPKYVLKEIKVNYQDGTSDSVNDQDFPYDISGNLTISTVNRKDGNNSSYEINEEFSIKNTKKQKGSVTVIKKGIGGTGETQLNGVEFQLQKAVVENDAWSVDPKSEPITKITADGQCVFEDLEEGFYLLTETKTVSGYTLLKEPVKITIPYVMNGEDPAGSPGTGDGVTGSDGETYYYNLTYTITNGQSFDLPQTGGTSADRIMRTGTVLFATAAGALLYLNRKRRREQQKS